MHAVPQQAHRNQDENGATHPIQVLQTATLLQPCRQGLATDGVNQLPHRFDDEKRHRQHQVLWCLRQACIDEFGKERRKKQNGFGIGQGHRHAHAEQFRRCGHDVFGITPNKKVADNKVQELRKSGRYGDWVVQEFESNDVKNITGLEQ